MINQRDMTSLTRWLGHRNTQLHRMKLIETRLKEIFGWDFTYPLGPYEKKFETEAYPESAKTPRDAKLLGYLMALMDFDGGRLTEKLTNHIFNQFYNPDEEAPESKARQRDQEKWESGAAGRKPSEYETIEFQAMYWERIYSWDYFNGNAEKKAAFPLSAKLSEEIIALNKRFLYSYAAKRSIDDKITLLIKKYMYQSKEDYDFALNWVKENGIRPIELGFFIMSIEQHWSGEHPCPDDRLQEVREDIDKARRRAEPAPIGLENVGVKDVPAYTYLMDQRCGCIWKTMSKRQITAMDLQRSGGWGLWDALKNNYPYMRLVRPGKGCLCKIRLRHGDGYRLGAHCKPCGWPIWEYDKVFTVVEKVEFDADATEESHPELKVEWQ